MVNSNLLVTEGGSTLLVSVPADLVPSVIDRASFLLVLDDPRSEVLESNLGLDTDEPFSVVEV